MRVQLATGVCKLDVRHAVNGTLLENRESSPVVINVGLEDAWRWLGRQATRGVLLVSRLLLTLLLTTSKDGRQQSGLLLFLITRRLSAAFFLPLLLKLNIVTIQNNTLSSTVASLHRRLQQVETRVVSLLLRFAELVLDFLSCLFLTLFFFLLVVANQPAPTRLSRSFLFLVFRLLVLLLVCCKIWYDG